jgi:anti-anti-sigma factor
MIQTASLSSDKLGDTTEVLTLKGNCDMSTALQAEQQIDSALEAGKDDIIVDLRGVTSLDRPMLQVLFRALIRMGQESRLSLVQPKAQVWELFEEAGLDRGFSTFADLNAALAAVSTRGAQNPLSPGQFHTATFRGVR